MNSTKKATKGTTTKKSKGQKSTNNISTSKRVFATKSKYYLYLLFNFYKYS